MFIYYVTPSIETKNPSYRFETVVLELVTGRTPWKNGPRVCLGFVFLGGRFSSETVSNREPFLGRKMDRFLSLDLIRQYINRHGFEQIKFINTGLYICTFVLFHPPVNSAKISIIGKERKKQRLSPLQTNCFSIPSDFVFLEKFQGLPKHPTNPSCPPG